MFEALGPALRLLRDRRRIRQYQLAELAGVTKAMLSSYETGSSIPSLQSLSSILHALNSDLHELQQAMDAVVGGRPENGEDRGTALEQPRGEAREVPMTTPSVEALEEAGKRQVRVLERLESPLRRIADAVEILAGRRD